MNIYRPVKVCSNCYNVYNVIAKNFENNLIDDLKSKII